jgi:ElaB/YqjD/DUF883 family membrane-anchored ribosome-binding protein
MSHVTTQKLLDDLKLVVHDAEELLKATAGQAGDHIALARAKAEASLRAAREQIAALTGGATTDARAAAERAGAYVQNNPWIAVGAAAAVGLVFGLLLGRRNGGGSK